MSRDLGIKHLTSVTARVNAILTPDFPLFVSLGQLLKIYQVGRENLILYRYQGVAKLSASLCCR